MKKLLVTIILLSVSMCAFAEYEEPHNYGMRSVETHEQECARGLSSTLSGNDC